MSGQITIYNNSLMVPTTVIIPQGAATLDFFNNSPNNLNCVIIYGDRQAMFVPANADTFTVFLTQLDLIVGHFARNPISMLVTPDGSGAGNVRIFAYDARWRKFRRGAAISSGQQAAIPVAQGTTEGGAPGGGLMPSGGLW